MSGTVLSCFPCTPPTAAEPKARKGSGDPLNVPASGWFIRHAQHRGAGEHFTRRQNGIDVRLALQVGRSGEGGRRMGGGLRTLRDFSSEETRTPPPPPFVTNPRGNWHLDQGKINLPRWKVDFFTGNKRFLQEKMSFTWGMSGLPWELCTFLRELSFFV